jgi:molybdate transport system substrate-binding protein
MKEGTLSMSFVASRALRAALAFALAGAAVTHAAADTVRVVAAGAVKHAVETLAPAFERATGHKLAATYDTVGAQRDRILAVAPGEAGDVVLLSQAALDQLRAAGRFAAPDSVPLGRVLVALAMPAGQAAPDISDPQRLRLALLAAPSIAYADPARGATAGTHFARVLDALQVREVLAPRLTVLPFGVDVIEAVAQGKYALGVSQSSEIMGHAGVRFVGPLPPPYEQSTEYGGALLRDGAAGRALLEFLARVEGLEPFRASGFAAPR